MQLSNPPVTIDDHPLHYLIALYQDIQPQACQADRSITSNNLSYSFIAILESCSMSSNVSLQFTNMEKWYSFPAEQTTMPSVNLDDSVHSFCEQKLSR